MPDPSAAQRYCAECGGVLLGQVSDERPHEPLCYGHEQTAAHTESRWQRFRAWLHDWIGRDNEPMSLESWWELYGKDDQ